MLVNLSLEPANKVRIVRAGAVAALVEVLRSGASAPEAREHRGEGAAELKPSTVVARSDQ